MIALVRFIWSILTAPFKAKSRLEVENAVLRRQLVVLQRKVGSVQNLSHILSGDGSGFRELLGIERLHIHVAFC